MGQRPAKKAPPGRRPKDQDKPDIQIDATRMIELLRAQRTELQNQLDFITCALQESQEREQGMLARIAELEDKETPSGD